MISRSLRTGILLLLFTASFGTLTNSAKAEPTYIGGFGFMFPHPTLGNEGTWLTSPLAAAYIFNQGEPDFGFVTSLDVRIDLRTYATPADPVLVEDVVFGVDVDSDTIADGTIAFSFDPAVFTQVPPPPGIIGSGDIKAIINGATTTLSGVSVSQFVGGSFQMTFTGAKITAGTGASGGGNIAYNLVPTASFTISTPEPTSVALAVVGLTGTIWMGYRRRRA